MDSKREAIRDVRSGSPGRRMYSASSPGPSPMWYCRSPAGIAILRSDGLFDAVVRVRQDLFLARVAASLARNSAEDSPAFSRASSRVNSCLAHAQPTIGSPDGVRRTPANVASRAAIRAAKRRSSVLSSEQRHGHRQRRDREQRAEAGGAGVDRPGSAAETGEPAGRRCAASAVVHARWRRVARRGWRAGGRRPRPDRRPG